MSMSMCFKSLYDNKKKKKFLNLKLKHWINIKISIVLEL